jgi:general secretion pathway protein A
MEACGLERPLPFDRGALRRVHRASRGVPRRINLLCDRALLGAYATGQGQVTRRIVDRAAAEVFPAAARPVPWWRRAVMASAVGLVAAAGLLAAATRVGEDRAAALTPAALPPPPQAAPVLVAATNALPPPPPAPVLLRDEQQAWRELGAAWKLQPPTGEPCEAFAREQVQCFSRNMNLALIRQLGRPGVLTLDVGTAQPSYAVLTRLTDGTATLQAAGTEQTVTLAALAQRWQGDFATLWRAPEGYRDGQGGVPVDWIAARLAALKGGAAPAPGARLDARLRAELRAFQLAHGLPADGQPGPLTYMQLNRAAGLDEPRLRTEP